ncbi:MAG: lysophospholipid acyltransferase family protein [Alphaproteobacteria bacterium]
MSVLRSLAFNAGFIGWTLLVALLGWPTLLMPRRAIRIVHRVWRGGVAAMLRAIVGIDVRWIGLERIPEGPVIFAAKHQSAWDTVELPWRLDLPAVVLKRELLWIPIYGWFLARTGMIAVDRAGRAAALRAMIAGARAAAADGRSILIFPEGTRVAPGARRPYHPGIAALYGQLRLPVVPIALDSGLRWGRRAFLKRPGTITVEVLDPIPPGLDRRAFVGRLETAIEGATDRLLTNARRGSC